MDNDRCGKIGASADEMASKCDLRDRLIFESKKTKKIEFTLIKSLEYSPLLRYGDNERKTPYVVRT